MRSVLLGLVPFLAAVGLLLGGRPVAGPDPTGAVLQVSADGSVALRYGSAPPGIGDLYVTSGGESVHIADIPVNDLNAFNIEAVGDTTFYFMTADYDFPLACLHAGYVTGGVATATLDCDRSWNYLFPHTSTGASFKNGRAIMNLLPVDEDDLESVNGFKLLDIRDGSIRTLETDGTHPLFLGPDLAFIGGGGSFWHLVVQGGGSVPLSELGIGRRLHELTGAVVGDRRFLVIASPAEGGEKLTVIEATGDGRLVVRQVVPISGSLFNLRATDCNGSLLLTGTKLTDVALAFYLRVPHDAKPQYIGPYNFLSPHVEDGRHVLEAWYSQSGEHERLSLKC